MEKINCKCYLTCVCVYILGASTMYSGMVIEEAMKLVRQQSGDASSEPLGALVWVGVNDIKKVSVACSGKVMC